MVSRNSGSVALWGLALLVGFSCAQQELTSFEEIKDFIDNEVGIVSTVIHFRHCESVDLNVTDTHFHIVQQYDQWLYFDYGNGTEKYRTTKNTINENGVWAFAIVETFNDDTAWIMIQHFDPLDFSVLDKSELVCRIGEGIFNYAYGKGRPTDLLSEYEDLKATLLEGKTVITKSEVSSCEGADVLGFARLINGKNGIESWEIRNNGLENETIVLSYDVWVDYPYYLAESQVGIEQIQITVRQDKSVTYLPIILDMLTWEDGFEFPGVGFQCELGSSFRAFTPSNPGGQIATYEDFDEVVNGLKTNHRPELVVDLSLCEVDNPSSAYYPLTVGVSPSVWVINAAEGIQSYVEMDVKQIGKAGALGEGLLVLLRVRITDDNVVSLDERVVNPLTDEIIGNATAICPLGSGAILRSVSRARVVLETFEDVGAALFEGRRLSWQADLSDCQSDLVDGSGITLGGTFVQAATFDPVATANGTFYAPVTELVEADSNLGTLEWMNIGLSWFGTTESLHVILSVFNGEWADIFEGGAGWVCPVSSGAGSLYY